MNDENQLLGAAGSQALPYEYQQRQRSTSRRRQIAQAIMQRAMGPLPQNERFGRYVKNNDMGNALSNAVQLYFANKDLGAADKEDADLFRQVGEAQSAERGTINDLMTGSPGVQKEQQGPVRPDETLPPITTGAVAPDPRKAIATAMGSKFGNIQAIGAQMQKERQAQLMKQSEMLGSADPVRGIAHMQGGDPMAPVAPIAPPVPAFGSDPSGNPFAVTNDLKGGKPTLSYAPKASTVTVNNKLTAGVDEDALKYFNYGGKGYTEAKTASAGLQNTANLLDTLDRNPTMGAGAGGIQFIRKWAQTLGAPVNEATTPTEMASMQLGQKTLDRLGGLGAQVSDSDRKFMLETQGSLGNDPEAVRRMLLLEAKYLMKRQSEIDEEGRAVAGRVPGATLPEHKFSFTPSQRNADDLERLFRGEGFAPAPATPRAPPAGRGRRVE